MKDYHSYSITIEDVTPPRNYWRPVPGHRIAHNLDSPELGRSSCGDVLGWINSEKKAIESAVANLRSNPEVTKVALFARLPVAEGPFGECRHIYFQDISAGENVIQQLKNKVRAYYN